ncbi:MAG: thiamine-phosphate synthase family protein [Sulfolobales archaeon]
MDAKALILNKFDLTLGEGIHVDIDLCKLFRVKCYPVITGITKHLRPILELKPEEIIKQLETLNINEFNTLKLDASIGVEVLEYIRNYRDVFEVKTITLNPTSTPTAFSHEDLNKLGRIGLFNKSDLLFINSEEAEYLSKMLNITPNQPKELFETLSKTLNINHIVLLNYRENDHYLNFIRYGEGNYVEFEAVTSLHKDLVATYVMVAVFNRVDLKQAVSDALSFATKALEFGIKNIDSVVPEVYASSIIDAERFKVINELAQAVNTIEENSQLIADLIPEVNMNIAYSLPKHFLKNLNDVAAIPGRITRVGNSVKAVSPPEFGASKHLARALMKVMEHSPEIRSIANIRFDTSILKIIEKLGYTHSFYDRSLEPPEIKSVEGATIPWGVGEAIKRVGYVPDVIYHKGDYGKEAMIAVLGRDPNDVVRKLLNIGRALKESEIRRWC